MKNHSSLHRRDFVQVGLLSAFGVGVGSLTRRAFGQAAQHPSTDAPAKKCILVWLDGGPSHLDLFDPKPDAPAEVRGPFSTLPTSVASVRLSEMLPGMAKRMGNWSIIRSMTSPLGEHNFGTHYLQTGFRPNPSLEYPSIGSVVAHHRLQMNDDEQTSSPLPAHIAVPHFRIGGGKLSGHGFLPSSVRPFAVGSDPAAENFAVRDLVPPDNLGTDRLERRQSFRQQFDLLQQGIDHAQHNSTTQRTADGYEEAYRLLLSNEARSAFELDQEPAETRARYGSKTVGQSCLLARRLIERDVPFVTVNVTGWDTHENAYTRLKEGYTGAKTPVGLVPSLDLALAGLIDDLSERGLLDETLVLVMGEFGRTPKLNTAGGRDHWPRVFSVAVAGGGTVGGQIIGASDRIGESPADRPITPSDFAASIYHQLGIPEQYQLQTSDGRPIRPHGEGRLIEELVG